MNLVAWMRRLVLRFSSYFHSAQERAQKFRRTSICLRIQRFCFNHANFLRKCQRLADAVTMAALSQHGHC